ncbi:MAG: hypothetical protein HY815_22190 [Candidatus Riflebacteria bacterium]|nr:hypothetical protein [Candidatus Riflebacteria bacterium]
MLDGLASAPLLHCAFVVMDGQGIEPAVIHGSGTGRGGTGTVRSLLAAGTDRELVPRAELDGLFAIPGAHPDVESFLVTRTVVLDSTSVQLWVGLTQDGVRLLAHIRPVIELITSCIHHMVFGRLLYEQLLGAHRQRGLALRRLLDAVEEERARIARDVHDEMSQVLNALLIHLETFPGPGDPEAQSERLGRAKGLVERILDDTYRLIRRLRPSELDDLGLVEAVRSTGAQILGTGGPRFSMEVRGDAARELPKEVELEVYRIFQEALTNVRVHARASCARAVVEIGPRRLAGSVEDDGVGLDSPGQRSGPGRVGFGLLGMRERAGKLGGRLEVTRSAAGGVRVEFEVALPGPEGAAA